MSESQKKSVGKNAKSCCDVDIVRDGYKQGGLF